MAWDILPVEGLPHVRDANRTGGSPTVSWGYEVTQRAIAELQDAALELARARRELGDLDGAEDAARRGLLLLDPADLLYLELAEIEAARGRPEHVSRLWNELRRRHAADSDDVGGLVTSPLLEVETAFQALVDPG